MPFTEKYIRPLAVAVIRIRGKFWQSAVSTM